MDMKVSEGVNISSLILGVLPTDADQVAAQLRLLAGVGVHAVAEDGRMIVSIETASEGATVEIFEEIRQMPGVLSASLVYHQYESDPDEEA
ncbi:chaperone NapD [Ferribacterium limneticum]|uniref:chaperone NapD n=1 Tax=Ferribacterium limneticum TaxID=76259 RepID=UPI001CF9BB8B|nr:chaperone NapD [Ferribacterium limneticum]UCV28166.1 chaperone NapD [Ferribacterium limneticum]UCV32083.1 chaperone NapD [Ferribacterium limneticum]